MMTDFSSHIGIILSLLTFAFYTGLYVNLLKNNKENIDRFSDRLSENNKILSDNISESNKILSKDIFELTKAVQSLTVNVATLDIRQTHLEKSQEKIK